MESCAHNQIQRGAWRVTLRNLIFLVLFRCGVSAERLHSWYSRLHNKARSRSAHLFRAHFFSRQIDSDLDLLGVCRYVARNPVEASLVRNPLDWRWSSARTSAGLERSRIPLDEEPLRAALGGGQGWRARYRDYVERAANASQPG